MTKVAINGMGRIGRAALKTIREIPDLELAAVNDLMPVFKEIEAYCYHSGLIR